MNRTVRTIISIVLVITAILFLWYFANIVFYILAAAVISMIGRPLVEILDTFRMGKLRIPHVISTILTLSLIVALFVLIFALFVPLIAQQARVISSIDTRAMASAFSGPLSAINYTLHEFALLQPGESMQEALLARLQSVVSYATFADALNYLISFTGSFFMAVGSILFISFFFLKDDKLFYNSFLLLVPQKQTPAVIRIISQIKYLLTRYFLGLCMELAAMITLLTLGLTIFRVQNALLLGFVGGLMNIIPYLGPLIGGAIGIIFGVIGSLAVGAYTAILPLSLTIAGVFAGANLIDNMLLQPIIYSTSVKAHPIEIFLVIIIFGSLFGIAGMILAVPAYTVIRVILREFFSEMRLVRKLTENM